MVSHATHRWTKMLDNLPNWSLDFCKIAKNAKRVEISMPTSMPDNLSQTLDNLIGPKFLGTESFLTLCPNTKVVRHWCRHPKFHVLTFLITFWQDFSWFCPKKSGTLLVIFFATKKKSWLLTAMLLEPIDPSGSGYPLPLRSVTWENQTDRIMSLSSNWTFPCCYTVQNLTDFPGFDSVRSAQSNT